MNKKIPLLLFSSVMSACSLAPSDSSNLQISMPPGGFRATSASEFNGQSLLLNLPDIMSNAQTSNGFPPPTQLADFTCFGVMVTGSGIQPDPALIQQCNPQLNGAPVNVGILGGFAPVTGGTIDVQIPSGSARTIQLFGIQSNIGCPTIQSILKDKGSNNNSGNNNNGGTQDLGDPFVLGTSQQDIFTDQSISIVASYTAPGTKVFGCGNDHNNNNNGTSNQGPGATVYGQHDPFTTTDSGNFYTTNPQGIAVDNASTGHTYIADTANNRVLVWNTRFPGPNQNPDLVLGQANFTSYSANRGSSANAGTMSGPAAVVSDGTHLYVSDTGNNRVLIWNATPTANGQSADIAFGQSTFTTSSVACSATGLNAPSGLAVNGPFLFIADTGNKRVMIYNASSPAMGQSVGYYLGESTPSTCTGGSAAGLMNGPQGITFDIPGNRIVVSDTQNNRVLFFNWSGISNGQAADLVLGQSNFIGNSYATTSTVMHGPIGVAVTPSGTVLVADSANHRVLRWSAPPGTNGQAADMVLGQPDFLSATPNNGGIQGRSLNAPHQIAVDGSGNLWITDSGNNRSVSYPY